jgi:phosphoserine phosphatase
MDARPTLLLTVTGDDRPRITATLLEALAPLDVEVLDLEQVVIRGRLLLGALIAQPEEPGAVDDALAAVRALGLEVRVEAAIGDSRPARTGRGSVTVLGSSLSASCMSGVAAAIADLGGNIDRIVRRASYPVFAVELEVSGVDIDELRPTMAVTAAELDVDIAVQPAGLVRQAKRVVVMDVDSTLVDGEVVEMLAAHAGCEREVAAITDRAMRGEIDFEESLRERVALLQGLPVSALDDVRAALTLMPGARTLIRTLRRLGYRTAIVSGGFSQITDALAEDLGIHDARANELEIVDGRLTGRLVGEVVDRAAKADFLRRLADDEGVPLDSTIAIGDGANDLDMIEAAGLGIAFNAKPVLRQAADTSVSVRYLDAVLYLIGISREDVEAADALA